jgi:hypothetical protein
MNDDRFNELLRDAAQTYRTPPATDFDGMWSEIEARISLEAGPASVQPIAVARPSRRAPVWMAIAATLVIGIGVGRISATMGTHSAPVTVAQAPRLSAPVAHADSAVFNSYEVETSKYLGQTAALLIALPSEVKSGRANEAFIGRAGDLLTTTRLLIDSPAASDPQMRNLLEDLEQVLAQVVRLQNTNSRTELDLINRALEQRDVLPRLRTAVASNTAN